MIELYQCATCGTTRGFNRGLAAGTAREEFTCPSCNETGTYRPIPFSSGYDRPHLLNAYVRATSLERVAGDPEPLATLRSLLGEADVADAEGLRDLAAYLDHWLRVLDVRRMALETCPHCGGRLGELERPKDGGDAWRRCEGCGADVYGTETAKDAPLGYWPGGGPVLPDDL